MKQQKIENSLIAELYSESANGINSLQESGETGLATGQVLCDNLDIRIDREGLWLHQGSPIGRKELVKLFSSVLTVDSDGRYWLNTPSEKGEVIVEDVPFLAVEMSVIGENKDCILKFRTNVDDEVIADEAHPIRVVVDEKTFEPSPYVLIRNGLEARLTRAVYYQMVEIGSEMILEIRDGKSISKKKAFGVWSKGQFFQIGKLEAEV